MVQTDDDGDLSDLVWLGVAVIVLEVDEVDYVAPAVDPMAALPPNLQKPDSKEQPYEVGVGDVGEVPHAEDPGAAPVSPACWQLVCHVHAVGHRRRVGESTVALLTSGCDLLGRRGRFGHESGPVKDGAGGGHDPFGAV